jgi:hypothetical protein
MYQVTIKIANRRKVPCLSLFPYAECAEDEVQDVVVGGRPGDLVERP